VLDRFMPTVHQRFERVSFNGTIGHVRFHRQKYLQHTLAVHEEILKLYLHPTIIECAEKYVEEPVQLQDYRIYQNFAGHRLVWHVDNKQTLANLESRMLSNKGLIVIIYLEDVNHGPFQIVRGSHHWAWKENKEVWEADVERFRDDIVTFNNKQAGTAIIYDFRAIHRAKPFEQGGARTALFAQYSGVQWPAGEPIILESGALKNLTEKQMQVLRFGRPATAPTWPVPADKAQPVPEEFFD
jgi:hypothetical protein